MEQATKKIGLSALAISLIAISGKFFGFVREVLLSHFWGASEISDAYIMSGNIVGILFGWVTTVYLCYTPIYAEVEQRGNREETNKFTRTVITFFLVVSLLCIFLVYIFPEQLVLFVAHGFSDNASKLTIQFLKISVLILLVEPIIYPLKAYLECNNKFVSSSLSDFFLSFTQMMLIVISGVVDYRILPFAMFLPYIVQAVIVSIFAGKTGFCYKPQIIWSDDIKLLFSMIVPYFISSLLTEINSLVDRYFASSLDTGSVAIVNYASVLQGFIMNVFSLAIMTIIYPRLSEAIAQGNEKKYVSYVENGIKVVSILFIPLSIGAIILSQDLVKCVYGHGAFDKNNIASTASVFVMYVFAIYFVEIRELLLRALYAKKNMKTPLLLGALSTIINIFLNTILVKKMGVLGLALSTSLATMLTLPIFIAVVKRKYINIEIRRIVFFISKIVLSSGVMGIVVFFMKQSLSLFGSGYIFEWFKVILCVITGVVIYFGLGYFMIRDDEVMNVIKKR